MPKPFLKSCFVVVLPRLPFVIGRDVFEDIVDIGIIEVSVLALYD